MIIIYLYVDDAAEQTIDDERDAADIIMITIDWQPNTLRRYLSDDQLTPVVIIIMIAVITINV